MRCLSRIQTRCIEGDQSCSRMTNLTNPVARDDKNSFHLFDVNISFSCRTLLKEYNMLQYMVDCSTIFILQIQGYVVLDILNITFVGGVWTSLEFAKFVNKYTSAAKTLLTMSVVDYIKHFYYY
jgi:hypothetical protein